MKILKRMGLGTLFFMFLCLLGLLFTAQCMGFGAAYEWAGENYGPLGAGSSLIIYFGIWSAVIFAVIGLPEGTD